MAKQFAYITVECLGLAFALAFAIFYFRLGWFVYPVWAVGLALVILVTQSHWRKSEKRGPAIAFVVTVYALSLVASWNACFDHVSHEVYLMTWEDKGPDNRFGEPEVLLQFVEFPGHFIGTYSSDLASYLSDAASPVSVTLEVTSDLGCVRGYRKHQVGEFKSWKSAWGYSQSSGNLKGPWKTPWWCP